VDECGLLVPELALHDLYKSFLRGSLTPFDHQFGFAQLAATL
jgi:hypothetical protein